jgi:hypothetical protein
VSNFNTFASAEVQTCQETYISGAPVYSPPHHNTRSKSQNMITQCFTKSNRNNEATYLLPNAAHKRTPTHSMPIWHTRDTTHPPCSTNQPGPHPPRIRLPIACPTDRLLLQRVLCLLEAQLPEYAISLFGQATGLAGMSKRFSDGEPVRMPTYLGFCLSCASHPPGLLGTTASLALTVVGTATVRKCPTPTPTPCIIPNAGGAETCRGGCE